MLGELFDPKADLSIGIRCRPHWSQAGAIVYITFRTIDSIPKEVLQRWEREKNEWMRIRGHSGHWSDLLPTLSLADQDLFHEEFDQLRKQCESWTHFTAVQIQRLLGENGSFWQPEPFDHLVRSSDQYEYLRTYIAENPRKANLNPGEYLYRQYSQSPVAPPTASWINTGIHPMI